jgi:hypothetical protein
VNSQDAMYSILQVHMKLKMLVCMRACMYVCMFTYSSRLGAPFCPRFGSTFIAGSKPLCEVSSLDGAEHPWWGRAPNSEAFVGQSPKRGGYALWDGTTCVLGLVGLVKFGYGWLGWVM